MDVWNRITKWLDHNRGVLLALVLAGIACAWLLGCQPTTQSLTDPAAEVTPRQLEREIIQLQQGFDQRAAMLEQQLAAYNADVAAANEQIANARSDLAEQLETRQQIVATLGGLATAAAEGSVNPAAAVGAVVSIVSLLGLAGTQYDRVRKDRVIARLKHRPPGPDPPSITT